METWRHVCYSACVESEDGFQGLVLSFDHVGPEDQTEVLRLGDKPLNFPNWTLVSLTILWHSFLGLGMDDPFTFCPLDSGRVIVAHRCLISQRPSHHKASCCSFSRLPGWEDLSACLPVCSPALSQYKFHQWGGLAGKALGAQVWWPQFHLWNPRKGGSGESAPQSCPLASPPTHTVIINTLL